MPEETQPAKPQAPSPKQTTAPKEGQGLSPTAKIIIGFCIGCIGLVILFFVGSTLFGRLFFRNIVGPSLEKSLEESLENSGAEIDKNKQETTVKDKEGNVSFKSGTQIPKSFPQDIPLYPGAKVIQSIEVGKALQVAFQTSDELEKAVNYYKSEMEKNGWKETANFNFERNQTVSYAKGGNRNAVVSAEYDETEKATVISITYEVQE